MYVCICLLSFILFYFILDRCRIWERLRLDVSNNNFISWIAFLQLVSVGLGWIESALLCGTKILILFCNAIQRTSFWRPWPCQRRCYAFICKHSNHVKRYRPSSFLGKAMQCSAVIYFNIVHSTLFLWWSYFH